MALTTRTQRIFRDALCVDKALSDEVIAKIQTPAALSTRAKKAMNIMLPDKDIYLEVITKIASGGPQSLSTKAKLMLADAICDKIATLNVVTEIES